MKKIFNTLLASLLFASISLTSLLCAAPLSVSAEETTTTLPETPLVNAAAAFAVDLTTGKIFYNQNGDSALPIASMTKMITLYLVEEAVAEGTLQWTDEVEISPYVAEISHDYALSNVLLSAGSKHTVKELFDAATIISANGAAIALAEKISGSEVDFVNKMRDKLTSWGIEDAYLVNSTGLPNSLAHGKTYPGSGENDENQMSARSLAIVARKLLQDYPEILETTSITSKTFAPGTSDEVVMKSSNWMLPDIVHYKEGVDGLKTGTTDLAGACFTGTIDRNGWRIITVVMNVPQTEENPGARFDATSTLMDYVYENWQQKNVLTAGATLSEAESLPVEDGKEESIRLALTDDVITWVCSDMDLTQATIQFAPIETELNSNGALVAPIEKNTEVGTVTIQLPNDTLGYIDDTQVELSSRVVTTEDVEKANFFVLMWRAIKEFFANLF